MCQRPNRGSVPQSLRALAGSIVTVASATFALVIALATAPMRLVTRPTKHGKPARTDRVEVQVHLSQRDRVRDIERSCRAALSRAAMTWAPFPLPLDRVEVLSSAPPLGKVHIYQHWAPAQGGASAHERSLVVVSVGARTDARELSPDEIAGALASQIERLVIDRYEREHPKDQPVLATAETADRLAAAISRRAGSESTPDVPPPDNVTSVDSVRALIAYIKKSQPLVPAGPSANGASKEPDPAA
jgi:hypothetical protein